MLWMLVPAAIAWGPTGHRAVGLIAERHLSRRARRGLSGVMGAESLARASTWPDEIRSDPVWQEREPSSSRWHYINAPPGQPIREPEGEDNLWRALERFEQQAADPIRPIEERRIAVRWLVHLVGDAHQPLHTGYAADRGGNSIQVRFFEQQTNLHRVFDDHLIEHSKLSYTELADFIGQSSPQEVSRLQASGLAQWLSESRALLPGIYALGDQSLGWAYVWQHTPMVERRLREAGIRLAGVLERVFAARR
jgi:hypothetical protein